MVRQVVIVGGGLAGLAAAVRLAGRPEFRVTLCESRPRWGGRASSFVDQTTGEAIDNCQHVALGCCTNFWHFCQTVGIDRFFQRETELNFIDRTGTISRMSASWLPAPFHLAGSFARLRFLSWRDKFRLASGLRALARANVRKNADQSFLDWLRAHHQTPAAIERFWHVVLVSALSETLDRIDVAHARKVFVDGFIASRHGWEVWIPTAPLDDLYGAHLENWLRQRGVELRLSTGVKRVLPAIDSTKEAESTAESSRVGIVEFRDEKQMPVDDVILAVPQNVVQSMLPDDCRAHPQLAGIDRLETAPISSVHLWFDRPITKLRHATLVDRQSQWLFNRSAIHGRQSASENAVRHPTDTLAGAHYYQVVISASRNVVEQGSEATIAAIVGELAEIWPDARGAKLLHSRLVTEHKAVVSMLPGVDRNRPEQQSPISNLQFAGDWTRTGWPGTMEGAVRSGYLAAENVLKRSGLKGSPVEPDLPTALLSKLLFGL